VLPLGAIEQHGPHLPLHTDLLVADAVANAAVERVGEQLGVWLLPPLAYTKSNEHAWAPGTFWLSAETLLAVLDDIGRCLAMTPARRLVVLNGHGGNSALVGVANRELRLRHGLMTFLAHPGVPPDQGGPSAADELGMGVHGGADETSLVLHLAPELVDMTAARRTVPGAPRRQPLRPLRGHGVVRVAVERLRRQRCDRRPHRRDRRARRRAVRRRGHGVRFGIG
jgi:creatinine amidohydrolase